MADDATQPSTQQMLDPRRMGRNNSGLRETDISDVICILHPASPAAFRVVATTAEQTPQHILQNDGLLTFDDGDLNNLDEQETFLLRSEAANRAQDLALRFSSRTLRPVFGFCFGRNLKQCDVVFNVDTVKRVSNLHFRIYINRGGVLMLEDVSTNGTLVDGVHLKGRSSGRQPATRMLAGGSILEVPSSKPDESIKFIVRIPSRDRHESEYRRRFDDYMNRITQIEEDLQRQQWQQAEKLNPGQAAPTQQRVVATAHPVITSTTFGMKWDGGNTYNVTGFLGKGAFANVYQLTTSYEGTHLAVKELEKRRFVKDGVLDRRLNSEMQIMKSVKHPNIVKYVDYRDENDHLYIIMEYVPCGDLQQYLKANEILQEPDAKLMARQTLRALAYLHANKITHRDIKPDNILLASTNPFSIKLSDFGLSKVVQTEDTFLTTFCGTLLYCAPEVFPHFDKEESRQGTKRRQPGGSGKQKFHSYSTAVDIWSFAGVLWFALCGYPPFEGVVDRSGRGMFEKIMRTDLDFRPLEVAGVPKDAQDLLRKMLCTVPSERPTAAQCLRHPWLADESEIMPEERDPTLNAIQEEEEDAGGGADAQVFSQLSIVDQDRNGDDEFDGMDDYDDFDFADVTRSKRVKIDGRFPRNQIRDKSDQDSSDDVAGGVPILSQPPSTGEVLIEHGAKRGPRLFGEIGESALESSGLLGERTNIALAIHTRAVLEQEARDGSYESSTRPQNSAAASLLGTESLVRELNMESPYSGSHEESDWKSSSSDSFRQGYSGMTDRQPASFSPVSQETPKARQTGFGRRFEVPISSMNSDNPHENRASSTPTQSRQTTGFPVWPSSLHNPQSANESVSEQGRDITPEDEDSATHQQAATAVMQEVPPEVRDEFRLNPPRYGTLISTTDSKHSLFLRIDNRTTTWGRDTSNTLVHPDKQDTRIPKRAFALIHHASGIERCERQSKDWTTLPGLHVLIKCCSAAGLWVNGTKLEDKGPQGEEYCGRVQTGDVITIFQPKRNSRQAGEVLRFVCTFYFGEGAVPRADNKPFEVLTKD